MNMIARERRDCSGRDLVSVEAALNLLCGHILPAAEIETVQLAAALNRVLAHTAFAPIAMPPHDSSAMDGFAFCHSGGDCDISLKLAGQALAGKPFGHEIGPGECVRIATGAFLSPGCDTIAIREQCIVSNGEVFIEGNVSQGAHIRRRGEDFCAGDVLVQEGSRLRPQDIGLLAAAGINQIAVRPHLRVAVFSTGNELCADGSLLQFGQIFDANRMMILSFCRKLGMEATDLGIVPDDRSRIASVLAQAAATHDVVIGSAGTSAGEEDHIAAALSDCGGEIIVSGIAIRPGKPVMFGDIGGALFIGLPGNPVAAVTTFLLLGLPILRRRAGERMSPARWGHARASFSHRKKEGIREYLRVGVKPGHDGVWVADKLAKQGSAMLTSLAACDGFLCLDETVTDVVPGTLLPYCPFSELLGL